MERWSDGGTQVKQYHPTTKEKNDLWCVYLLPGDFCLDRTLDSGLGDGTTGAKGSRRILPAMLAAWLALWRRRMGIRPPVAATGIVGKAEVWVMPMDARAST